MWLLAFYPTRPGIHSTYIQHTLSKLLAQLLGHLACAEVTPALAAAVTVLNLICSTSQREMGEGELHCLKHYQMPNDGA
ncbi:uncharacterized protein BO80DRAFT_425436 [Aspergillus ibericus CBS 121593]|uniref:Uncharacterized protein n=1 Tax=Aspergillus ibericus CBS 121593 TaxID=1448316 RepID=A0A395H194_9EURO|nr:hypothetical protein BO80DRAFT_425436 [Aspergillus ibericus CBS 121593]RAL00618.1 hypothetical protein BO80DRAFT_425436 [Aspergillus ibericus CBS 121593]